MSFVWVKAAAQPPAIPHECLSVCLLVCMSGHVAGRPDPPKSGSDCLHDCFSDGGEDVERGFGLMEGHVGKRRRMAGGREGGGELGRKGKCGSTQSKPCHMFQSAGIWPPVQTRMLCKRLLIRESACRKTEFQSGLRWLSGLSAAILSHGVTACERSIAGSANWLPQTDPMRMWFGVQMKQESYMVLIFNLLVWKSKPRHFDTEKKKVPESGLSALIATTCH